MTISAHAIGFIDTREMPPRVTSVRIYSACAGDIATDQKQAYPFDIHEACADDYGEAHAAVMVHLERFYPWALKLLDAGIGAIQ